MKIEKSVRPATSVSGNEGPKRVGQTDTASSSPGQVQDSVHISSASKQTTDSSSVVDAARVQEIKNAISDGTFKVNPEAVADRLLETARELIQSKKGNS